ncbi:MAG: hypothetical protein HDS45_05060 [Bacteroides sp.]|nr:hypothetical protein [Bacteroides sp.]MBD5268948.1 hypothetical protein [Bacteroides sp.]
MTNRLADVSMVRSRYYNDKKGLKFYKFTQKSMCKNIEIMKSLRRITYSAIQNEPEVHLEKGKCYKKFSDEKIEIIKKVSNCRCKAVILPLNELNIQSHNRPQFLLDENWIMVDESAFERINEKLRSVLLEIHKCLSDIYAMFNKTA